MTIKQTNHHSNETGPFQAAAINAEAARNYSGSNYDGQMEAPEGASNKPTADSKVTQAIIIALAPCALEREALRAISNWFASSKESIGDMTLDGIVHHCATLPICINYVKAATALNWGNLAEQHIKREISYNIRCWIDSL